MIVDIKTVNNEVFRLDIKCDNEEYIYNNHIRHDKFIKDINGVYVVTDKIVSYKVIDLEEEDKLREEFILSVKSAIRG